MMKRMILPAVTIMKLRLGAVCAFLFLAVATGMYAEKPNFLIITVDDMNFDSVGAFGCELSDTTPNIDQLARQGLRFHHAHMQSASCYPSRNVLFSGRYSHNTSVEGFYQVNNPTYPHMVDLMKAGGYYVAIRGKVEHSTPYQPYGWDDDLTTLDGEEQHMKDPSSYYRSAIRGIERAALVGKPFCLSINISDPHKPFYALKGKGEIVDDKHVPSRIYKPEEVPVPGFLADHPNVRLELAHYYSSVRRADDCVENIIQALDESGKRDDTVIVFLSDHGMPFPFAKTGVWNHSTRTPWIVIWPGVTEAGGIDKEHMISAVDFLPTLLDMAGLPHPDGFDGRSFVQVLRGGSQPGRDYVYKFHNENSGRRRTPMRSVQSKRYGYIYNPWSNGERLFITATRKMLAYDALKQLGEVDSFFAERVKLFDHGVPEEFYDYENDPDALHNLIDNPEYAEVIEKHRTEMLRIMRGSNDHALEAFEHRDDPTVANAYVDRKQAEADARKKSEELAKKEKQ